jgi:DNA-binding NarL/FixJ family response regulator
VPAARLCTACRRRYKRGLRGETGDDLTFREWQVVAGIANGKLNKEIAHMLNLTEGTVRVYVARIFRKVGVNNRTLLARRFWVGPPVVTNSDVEHYVHAAAD